MIWKLIILTAVATCLSLYYKAGEVAIPPVYPSPTFTLFLSGDVMTGRGVDQVLPYSVNPDIYESYVKNARDYVRLAEKKNGPIEDSVSYAYIWGDALEVWKVYAADIKIINLETSVTNHNEPWPGKGIHYRMHPDNIPVLAVAGIDIVSLANNHMLDWGRPGLSETLKTLEAAGVVCTGAGEDIDGAREPAILKKNEGRVVVLAYGAASSGVPESWAATKKQSGVNLLPNPKEETVKMIASQVEAVKQPRDVVIFSVHWGSNWGYHVPLDQREFAHQLIDAAGVDIIHGHSSHHPRGIEVYNDKLILYGAGDFINDYEGISGYEQYRDDLSLMYFPEVNPASGELKAMKMVPLEIKNFRLNHASSPDAEWLQNVLDRESQKFGTRVKLEEDGSLSVHW